MLRRMIFEMKLKQILAVSLGLLTVMSLTACAGSGKPIKSSINVYNWGEYIDESVNTDFTKATGIKVNYSTFDTNEALYAKLKTGGTNYDVVIPSDYMISRMISEDMLEKLDFDKIPNSKDLDPKYKGLAYDKTGEYSVPYMWGVVGIVYNKTMVKDPVDSWNILWDEKYKGKILMFENSRDAIGIALKKLGYSFNTTSAEELKKAAAELATQKPLVQAYVMDQIYDKMENGEAAVAPYYAGDAIQMMQDNKNLAFAVPKEGTNLFVDAMVIPKGSTHKADAEAYINYLCSAGAGVKNCKATGYSTPMTTTFAKLPSSVKNNKYEYPDDAVLKNTEIYTNLPQGTLDLYDSLWTQIVSK
jgi:spermidine/putrescine transport system substrate-binding protein